MLKLLAAAACLATLTAAPARVGVPLSTLLPVALEHTYRVTGEVRLLLLWVGSDNVGGARITRRADGRGARVLSLLIGTDPERAPRRLNEWGYLREEVWPGRADVFGVRSVTDADSAADASAKLDDVEDTAAFAAICSSVRATAVTSSIGRLRVPSGVTFRGFDRLLDGLVGADRWETGSFVKPPGAAPGFLTAVEQVIARTLETRSSPISRTSIEYFYRNARYELALDRAERLDRVRIRTAVVRDLIRAEFRLWKIGTNAVTRFDLTYGTKGALEGVPVQATYRPKWWLRIHLTLDDSADVPPDPGGRLDVLARMDETCARSAGRPAQD